jgi:hypothetical protein
MATVAEPLIDSGLPAHQPNPAARAIDRWIYVFMAGWFIVIALAGFIPDALTNATAIKAGQAQPYTSIMPLHAGLMVAWLALLLGQTILMATGKGTRHQWLGKIAFALVPAMVITMLIAIPASYRAGWHFAQSAPPHIRDAQFNFLNHSSGALLGPLQGALSFPVFVFLALRARRTNPALHKRMIILATAAVLPAALVRMTWLPTFPFAFSIYLFAALSPMILWDVIRTKSVPPAYLIWLAIWVPVEVAVFILGGQPWLDAAIPHLMRV